LQSKLPEVVGLQKARELSPGWKGSLDVIDIICAVRSPLQKGGSVVSNETHRPNAVRLILLGGVGSEIEYSVVFKCMRLNFPTKSKGALSLDGKAPLTSTEYDPCRWVSFAKGRLRRFQRNP
jgi:hypothetical protein